jgi:hypothetical protein
MTWSLLTTRFSRFLLVLCLVSITVSLLAEPCARASQATYGPPLKDRSAPLQDRSKRTSVAESRPS